MTMTLLLIVWSFEILYGTIHSYKCLDNGDLQERTFNLWVTHIMNDAEQKNTQKKLINSFIYTLL